MTKLIKGRPSKPISRFRGNEFKMILSAGVCVIWSFLLSHIYVLKERSLDARDYLVPFAFLCACFIAHLILSLFRTQVDQTILPVMTLLGGFGLAFQYRLGLSGIEWQSGVMTIIWIVAPVLTAVIATVIRLMGIAVLHRIAWLSWFVVCLVPLGVLVAGRAFRGATFGPGMTTPTEFVKPFFIIGLASLLVAQAKHLNSKKGMLSGSSIRAHGIIIAVWGIPQILFLLQHDLGMIAILLLLFLMMLTAATGRKRYLAGGISVLIAGGWMAAHVISRIQVRLDAWLVPFEHADSSGYQIMHALFAIFNGEFLGRGFGGGVPGVIPLVRTDFVYASMAEEIGLLGTAVFVLVFMYVSIRAHYIASIQRDPFAALIAVGCGVLIWVQVLLNIGGVIKLIPMTGVPLPFISQGGSATLSFSIVFGLLLAVSRSTRR